MSKVVIYGLGNDYMNEDWSDYNIIAVSDSNICLREQYHSDFVLPEDISNYDYDYVIIASERHEIEIINSLVDSYDIPIEKIRTLRQIHSEKNSNYFYGQELDDMKLLLILKSLDIRINDVTYLELGTNHPIWINNTYFFYKNGARGVLVEPNKKLHTLIKCVRPNDYLIPKAVDVCGVSETIFYEYAANTLSTTNQEDKCDLGNMEEFEILSKEYVETICINDILESMNEVPTILSIDIEGKDLEILKDINFDKYKPLLIVAELAGYKFRTDMHSKIKDFLESEGYILLPYWDNEINGIFIVKERYKELTKKIHI